MLVTICYAHVRLNFRKRVASTHSPADETAILEKYQRRTKVLFVHSEIGSPVEKSFVDREKQKTRVVLKPRITFDFDCTVILLNYLAGNSLNDKYEDGILVSKKKKKAC